MQGEEWIWQGPGYGGVPSTQSAVEIKYAQGCPPGSAGRMGKVGYWVQRSTEFTGCCGSSAQVSSPERREKDEYAGY